MKNCTFHCYNQITTKDKRKKILNIATKKIHNIKIHGSKIIISKKKNNLQVNSVLGFIETTSAWFTLQWVGIVWSNYLYKVCMVKILQFPIQSTVSGYRGIDIVKGSQVFGCLENDSSKCF